MDETIKWGILGTGGIARVFTEDLLRLPGHEVLAVGSRTEESAAGFADRHSIARAYGSYAELAADSEIDVVYVATPHPGHHPHAALCLEAGRAVLVEKPFTVSADEARRLVTLARRRGLFAMEAMWTRFNPAIRRLRSLVDDGAIGEVTAVYADFAERFAYDPEHRVWSAAQAGGALLDLGVYPLSFAWMLLGAPQTVRATTAAAPTGVDANTGILLGYASGAIGLLHCGLTSSSPQTATVVGTVGRIEVSAPFFRTAAITLHRDGAAPETFAHQVEGHGYVPQAQEVARCLRAGELESPLMPLDESVAVLGALDTIAAQLRG